MKKHMQGLAFGGQGPRPGNREAPDAQNAALAENKDIFSRENDPAPGLPGADAGPASSKKGRFAEAVMARVFKGAAWVSIGAVALICLFLATGGLPALMEIGPLSFLTGRVWRPGNDIYGIFPMILASLYVTAGAVAIGVPVGVLTAVYMARFCPPALYKGLKPAVDLLAGIPSIVYGFFGLSVIVPFVRNTFGGRGTSMLSAILVLAIMLLPTVIGVSESALRAVPTSYYEGSLALGAGHERSVFRVVLPAARSGLLAAAVLGVGRAVGETMAVVMVAGNQTAMPSGLLKGVRTMTGNIVMEMGYATDLHRGALIATAVVLFVFVMLINLCITALSKKGDTQ